jgi:hypothetical protein
VVGVDSKDVHCAMPEMRARRKYSQP